MAEDVRSLLATLDAARAERDEALAKLSAWEVAQEKGLTECGICSNYDSHKLRVANAALRALTPAAPVRSYEDGLRDGLEMAERAAESEGRAFVTADEIRALKAVPRD